MRFCSEDYRDLALQLRHSFGISPNSPNLASLSPHLNPLPLERKTRRCRKGYATPFETFLKTFGLDNPEVFNKTII